MDTENKTNYLTLYTEPPKSVDELKQRVIHLIDQGWTKHALARDEKGKSINSSSENAVEVCLLGAIRRATTCNEVVTYYGDSVVCRLMNEFCSKLEEKLRKKYPGIIGAGIISHINDVMTDKGPILDLVKSV